jgi:hypothetical protein
MTLAVTPGEPAGIGPDLVVTLAASARDAEPRLGDAKPGIARGLVQQGLTAFDRLAEFGERFLGAAVDVGPLLRDLGIRLLRGGRAADR